MASVIRQLLSKITYKTDGTTTVWNFGFAGGYIDALHVRAQTYDPVTREITQRPINISTELIGPFQLEFIPAIPDGLELTIYRDTPKERPLVNFTDRAQLTEAALDLNATQAIFGVAEAWDLSGIVYQYVSDQAAAWQGLLEGAQAAAAAAAASAAAADGAADDAQGSADQAQEILDQILEIDIPDGGPPTMVGAFGGDRNRILNGACRLYRLPVDATNDVSSYGGPDMFQIQNIGTGTVVRQEHILRNYLGRSVDTVTQTCLSGTADVTGSKYLSGIQQNIEGLNCSDLVGKEVVSVSFLFWASVLGEYSVSLRDATGTRSFVARFPYFGSLVPAGSAVLVTVQMPGVPVGANVPHLPVTGLIVNIGALNSTPVEDGGYSCDPYSGSADGFSEISVVAVDGGSFGLMNGNWQATNGFAAKDLTIWATPGNYISVSELQLEDGVPTAFERRDIGREVAACSRYYQSVRASLRTHASAADQIYETALNWPIMRQTPVVSTLGMFATANAVDIGLLTVRADGARFGFKSAGAGDTYALDFEYALDARL